MPTTTYTDLTMGAYFIGERTDLAGGDVDDATGEEMRIPNAFHVEGAITPNAFKVAAQTVPNMTVKVGSGTAKTDVYLVEGTASGQGNYFVRLEGASQNVTISPSEPAATRTDEVYIVVHDSPYDANAVGTAGAAIARAQLAYRKGDAGGAAPGPDAAWKAYAKIGTITVPAADTAIANDQITDPRPDASFVGRLGMASLLDIGDITGSPGGAGQAPLWNGSGFEFAKPGLIQYVPYNPGSPTTLSTTTTSSSGADLDSSNLAAAFTAPASGAVLVHLDALVGNTETKTLYWCLREGSGLVAGTSRHISQGYPGDYTRQSCDIVVTGLTPGVAYTYKWGAYHVGGAVAHGLGGVTGPMTMLVFAA